MLVKEDQASVLVIFDPVEDSLEVDHLVWKVYVTNTFLCEISEMRYNIYTYVKNVTIAKIRIFWCVSWAEWGNEIQVLNADDKCFSPEYSILLKACF